MNPIERLRSVLCDPEGKCCIVGSDEDRRIVDEALCDMALAHPERLMGEPVASVLVEIEKAVRKFPTWPTDPLHALAVLGEEYGELNKAVLQWTYEPHKTNVDEIRTEAIQTAAMAIRFLHSLNTYDYKRCEQHKQPPLYAPPEVKP